MRNALEAFHMWKKNKMMSLTSAKLLFRSLEKKKSWWLPIDTCCCIFFCLVWNYVINGWNFPIIQNLLCSITLKLLVMHLPVRLFYFYRTCFFIPVCSISTNLSSSFSIYICAIAFCARQDTAASPTRLRDGKLHVAHLMPFKMTQIYVCTKGTV